MKPINYILDKNNNAVACKDMLDWALNFEDSERVVQQNEYIQFSDNQVARCFLSTVFIGIDMNHMDTGKPILWESMLFENGDTVCCKRYSTHTEALNGHVLILKSQKQKLQIALMKAAPVSIIFIAAVITLSQWK